MKSPTLPLVSRFSPASLGQGMLVAIDASLTAAATLAKGILPGADLLWLHPAEDGIEQISNYLRQHSGYHSLHLLTHGAPGSLYLGATKLTAENLAAYTPLLQQWRQGFAAQFELLLYGCQVASNAQGKDFVKQLAAKTGATVAASSTLTGNAALEGNWQLDVKTGSMIAPLAIEEDIRARYPAVLIGTTQQLIDAINAANQNPDPNTINLNPTTFNLTSAYEPGPGIYGPTGLPSITSDITINGNGATIQRDGGAPNFRIFFISGPGGPLPPNGTSKLTLDNVTVRGGRAVDVGGVSDDGGGIFNIGGELIVRNNSVITDNFADDDGGGIANVGTGQGVAKVTIQDSTISNNTAKGVAAGDGGGGIDNDGNKDLSGLGAEMTIVNSTITGNSSTNGDGGGIRNQNGSSLDIQGSNITNNTAQNGSGIAQGALPEVDDTTLSLTNTTIENNSGGLDVEDAFDEGEGGATAVINGGGNKVERTNVPELQASFLVERLDNNQVVQDGTTQPINVEQPITFRITNEGTEGITLGTPTSGGNFLINTDNFTTNLAGEASTTFTVELAANQLGTFNDTIQFNAPNELLENPPFDFAVTGTVESLLTVTQVGNNQVVQDGTTQPIDVGQPTTFSITNEGSQQVTLGTPTTGGNFSINTDNFTTDLAAGASTTFTVELAANQVGTFTDTIQFNVPNGTLQTPPFDFAVTGTVESPLKVTQVGNNQVVQDGTTQPINVEQATVFQVTNEGDETLTLEQPTIDDEAFIVNLDSFDTELAAGESTRFAVQLNTETVGTFNGTVEFGVPSGTLSSPPFDFVVGGTVPEETPEPPSPQPPTPPSPDTPSLSPELQYNPQSQLFTMGSGGQNLSFQLTGVNAAQITQVSIVFQQEDGSLGGSQNLFSLLPTPWQPPGFAVSQQDFILPQVAVGQQFLVELQRFDGSLLSRQVEVTQEGGSFNLSFAEGISLTLQQTSLATPLGVGDDQGQDLEVLDLEAVSESVSASFTLYREANFNNTVGLYRLDDASGAVNGIAPGDAGYAEAAISSRVAGVSLSVGDENTASTDSDLAGGGLYAPFIVANGTIEQFLDDNANNTLGEDLQAYFVFAGANPDQADHIRLLGSNLFGFEDLPGGGDNDFNDLIIDVNVTV
ncbi:DUF4347 domain-containing protein [Spirulina sp. CS-785/01]|uniref:DUF4347 domain-containing protein n=1 Tax=Spirulina sp. CS-785/01 TaxID=3021716 RepID=UPI002330BC69|nr:DUF4347 domain-containing protein [Spirulina sp. CS-785/01]MDB9312477.1 DUF4347 domain-containing protein [Spirulina sp. CS-785/01]